MQNLISEWEKPNSPLQSKLTLEDLLPVDKMKLKHAVALIDVADDLRMSTNLSIQGIGTFFNNLRLFYRLFHDNNTPFVDR